MYSSTDAIFLRANYEELKNAIDTGKIYVNKACMGKFTPLTYYVNENRADLVRLFIEKDAGPFIRDSYGFLPSEYAKINASVEIKEMLETAEHDFIKKNQKKIKMLNKKDKIFRG